MKNADQDFFNNQKDLNSKKEEVVVIHDLSAYEGNQGNLILSKFYVPRIPIIISKSIIII